MRRDPVSDLIWFKPHHRVGPQSFRGVFLGDSFTNIQYRDIGSLEPSGHSARKFVPGLASLGGTARIGVVSENEYCQAGPLLLGVSFEAPEFLHTRGEVRVRRRVQIIPQGSRDVKQV